MSFHKQVERNVQSDIGNSQTRISLADSIIDSCHMKELRVYLEVALILFEFLFSLKSYCSHHYQNK